MPRVRRRVSLIWKIIVTLLLVQLVMMAMLALFQQRESMRSAIAGFKMNADRTANRVPSSIVYPLFNFDMTQVEFLLSNLITDPDIAHVELRDATGLLFSAPESTETTNSATDSGTTAPVVPDEADDVSARSEVPVDGTLHTVIVPVVFDDGQSDPVDLGTVAVTFSMERTIDEVRSGLLGAIAGNVGIALAIGIVVSLLLMRIVSRPIKRTKDVLEDIAEGEGDLTRELDVRSRDELADLAAAFNTFVRKLRESIGHIQESFDQTIDIKDALGSNTVETVAAVNEMGANIDSTKEQMRRLSKTIGESTRAVETILGNVEQTRSNIKNQNTMVEESTSAVTEMVASIQNVSTVTERRRQTTEHLVESARLGGDKLDQTSAMIVEITNSIDQIESMVSIINNIAAQTNLLAMNAAIEAAHAGDAGRGFAVVADEIRKLAESSGQNAKNISTILGEIITNIEAASRMSSETQAAFENIDREVTDVSNSLKEINTAMSELATGSTQIQKAIVELSDVSQQVEMSAGEMEASGQSLSETMGQVGDISRIVSSAMEEIAVGTGEINNAMNQVSDLNQKMGDNADRIKEEIDQFKIVKNTYTSEGELR